MGYEAMKLCAVCAAGEWAYLFPPNCPVMEAGSCPPFLVIRKVYSDKTNEGVGATDNCAKNGSLASALLYLSK